MPLGLYFLLWVGLASLATFALFGLDKVRAERGLWRVSERQLLLYAAVGGMPGAKLAQRYLRHKTRKEPFRTQLNAILALQVAAILIALGSWGWERLGTALALP